GDVQSCAGALAKLKEHYGGWDPRTLFVFVGDLFDRGPDAAGVAELIGVRPPDNVVLVEGNHDENLRFLLAGLSRAGFPDTRVSLEQLRAVGYTKKDLADLVERFVPAYALRFAGRSFLVTHAGLAPATIDAIMHVDDQGRRAYDFTHLPLRQLLLGSSSRQQTYRGFSQYDRSVEAALSHPQIVQVHGHRNGTRTESPGPEAAAPNVWALEQRVEHGGHLAALEVNADGRTQVVRFREERTTPALDPNSLLAHMAAHPEVIVRPVEGLPGVVSCNFTRRAFATRKWDDVSCKARGLFLDRESRVVARGYDKFFNVGEALAPRDLDDVVTRGLGRPLTVRRKWNGYLALVAVVAGELRVFSKAGVTPYSRHAAEMLQAHLGERVAELAARLAQAEVTLTFEVISERDPHLVDEGANQLVLLDAIANQETFTLRPAVRAEVERDFGFVSPPVEVISEAADDAARLALAARAAACEAEGAEGLVITYGDGQLTKYKSAVYTRRKAFRSLVERHLAGRKVEPRGAGAELFARFLERDDLTGFWVEGLRGPTLNIPALVASL
ncbi:RNA ligase, partial [Buchananella hordeovulneris]|uniref:RNA ligase n=1 Tax=Buchananella hordeovulneris TaxID=52770 RepID=UPI000AAD4F44